MSQENKIVKAFGWQSLNAVCQSVIQLIFNAIMARLIAPESFGVMAIVLIFIGFIEIFGQIGIGPAIIQRKEITSNQLKSSFYLSLVLSVIFFLLVYFFAPEVAAYYSDNSLTPLLQATALSFIIAGIGIVPKSMLFRNLRFKELFISTMIGMFLGLIVIGLPCAYMGFEVWAIVIYLLSQNLILTICYWYFNPINLKGKATLKHAFPLIRYGGGSTLFTFFNFLSSKVDTFIVSRFYGAAQSHQNNWSDTGVYDQSIKVMGYPITIIGKLSDSILFSGLSRIQDQKQKLKYAFKTAFLVLTTVALPASLFLSIYAREVVLIILGDQYLEAIPIVQILFLGLFLRTIIKLCDAVVRALDRIYLGALIKFVYFVLIGIFVYIMATDISKDLGIFMGLKGVAMALLAAVVIQFIIILSVSLRTLELSVKEILPLLKGPLAITVLVASTTYGLKILLDLETLPALVGIIVGLLGVGLSYLAVLWFTPQLFGRAEHNTLLVILKRLPQKGIIRDITENVKAKTL